MCIKKSFFTKKMDENIWHMRLIARFSYKANLLVLLFVFNIYWLAHTGNIGEFIAKFLFPSAIIAFALDMFLNALNWNFYKKIWCPLVPIWIHQLLCIPPAICVAVFPKFITDIFNKKS